MHSPIALFVIALLAAAPLPAFASSWSEDDVSAAEHYRERERERARRYRAEVVRNTDRRPAEAVAPAIGNRAPATRSPAASPKGLHHTVWEIVAGLDVDAPTRWIEATQRSADKWRARLEPWLTLRARFEAFVESGPRWPFEAREEP